MAIIGDGDDVDVGKGKERELAGVWSMETRWGFD